MTLAWPYRRRSLHYYLGVTKEAFLGGLDHPYVQKREYTAETVDGIVGDFLVQYDDQTKDIRFNLFIDSKINGYLQRTSTSSGRTKAEIVRELLLRDMEGEQRQDTQGSKEGHAST
jgi:hypothetical protein